MTLSEFKAWFEGFTEGIDGAPTAEQFAKIKAKVEKIDGAPVTYSVFVDRGWPKYRDRWQYTTDDSLRPLKGWYASGHATGGYMHHDAGKSDAAVYAGYLPGGSGAKGGGQTQAFDSHAAMFALGKLEAAA